MKQIQVYATGAVQSEAPTALSWIPVSERMPASGEYVIAFVKDAHGGPHSRRIRAGYAAAKTLEQSPECDGGEYDEDTGTYYCAEGWYECNAFEETHWAVDAEVTHWMPLPPPPVEAEPTAKAE